MITSGPSPSADAGTDSPAPADAVPRPAPATAPHGAREVEDDLRARLGLRALGARLDPAAVLWGWLGPLLVTAVAAVMRLVGLNHPGRLIFDETYYVKQAYSLLTLGYEGQWAEDSDPAFARGDYSGLSTEADYVVHGSVGKWMIAVGLRLFGADNGAGWRFSAAIVGTLSVLLLARLATRMFGSALLGTTAGLLLAIDGIHLTESRTSLLDIFLMFWVLVGFWCVLRDREASRARLAHRTAAEIAADGALAGRWGPRLGVRWWLVAAGVAMGLATGVKWSGLYAVAVFGVMVFVWDTCARRVVGVRTWLGGGVLRGGIPAFLALVPTAALTYLATWLSWFVHPGAYRRQWAADLRTAGEAVPRDWLPDALNSWWEYHLVMWDFHNGLDSEHAYEANPAGWLLQLRPTSMYWPDPGPPPEACGADRCVEAILAVGSPVVWWFGAAALVLLLVLAVRSRDWRAWAVLAGYGAMYVPWLGYAHRTIFTFYSVAFVPYVALCLTLGLAWGMDLLRPPRATADPAAAGGPTGAEAPGPGPWDDPVGSAAPEEGAPGRGPWEVPVGGAAPEEGAAGRGPWEVRVRPAAPVAPEEGAPSSPPTARAAGRGWRASLRFLVSDDGEPELAPRAWLLWGIVVGLAVVAAVFFWPVWTGQTIPYEAWRLRMWLPSWI
ncbi:phospholipid carrier-dependent glycosyltransferase [Georgenia sp. AZ-5]|uniref:dolichyl-phosphate-mannose--protein mannosyltransferase n=1 Tax=Georgenia sp. AZ-5 TaxID=3367526 RepID=UPI003754C472